MKKKLTGWPVASLAAALLLAGCASTKGIDPEAKMREPAVPHATTQPVTVSSQWWRDFGDPQLDALEEQALRDSPTLGVARARLRRAQSATELAHAATQPQMTGEFDVTRQHLSKNGIFPPPLGGATFTTETVQGNLNWDLDFFGKNQAALRASLGAARAAEADVAAARLLLASNVARTYFQLVRSEEQLGVARRTLAQREEQLKLVQQRVTAGLDTTLELRQAQGGMPEARQQVEALNETAHATRNALAALLGTSELPQLARVPAMSAIKTSTSVPALPADLLGRRPDVAAARGRVEAATQNIKSAKAEFYPSVNLVGFAGLNAVGLDRLIDIGSRNWSIGPAIRLPIFQQERLRANLRGRTADLDEAIESYNGAVVEAIHEAADAVASLQSLERQISEQHQALVAAEGAYDIAVQRYKAGLGTYLNVLAAENTVLAQRRLGVDLAARVLDARVALYRALGGGYTDPETAVATH
jgi:NodT family efflux transporter outer membrane factor (OMF) lipoprotein